MYAQESRVHNMRYILMKKMTHLTFVYNHNNQLQSQIDKKILHTHVQMYVTKCDLNQAF